jgi:hypothetical protein
MSLLVEGGALGAVALAFARRRPRRGRVRREPIDVERLAAEFAEPPRRTELEIVAALEAEVRRMNGIGATTEARGPAPIAPAVPDVVSVARTDPALRVIDIAARDRPSPVGAPSAGLPLDQVRAWLEQVKDDLRKVQARVEYLQFEQSRLQGQQHLVAELISATTAV